MNKEKVTEAIKFRGVTFQYPTATDNLRNVLDGVDFDIIAGETTAIVGPSGSGKSTLLNLLCGLQTPDEGVITIVGESFGSEPLEELLDYLEEQGVVHREGEAWHWTEDSYPANSVSLRSVAEGNFVVVDQISGTTARYLVPAVRANQTRQHLQRRGLPGPIGPHQAEHCPRLDGEGDVFDRLQVPVPFRQAVDVDHVSTS